MRKALDKWFAVSEGEFYTWLGKRALIAVSAPEKGRAILSHSTPWKRGVAAE
jgi:hypothetical protein